MKKLKQILKLIIGISGVILAFILFMHPEAITRTVIILIGIFFLISGLSKIIIVVLDWIFNYLRNGTNF